MVYQQIGAAGVSAFGIVNGAKTTDGTIVNGALRNLPRSIPLALEMRSGKLQFLVVGQFQVVFRHHIKAVKILRRIKRTVKGVERGRHISIAVFGIQKIEKSNGPKSVKLPVFHGNGAFVEFVQGFKGHVTRSGKIAVFRVVRTFSEGNFTNRFGNYKVQITVPLPVRVRHHIYGHSVHRKIDVRSVVNVETAQKYLFRFSTAGVLADNQSRNFPKNFLRRFYGRGL